VSFPQQLSLLKQSNPTIKYNKINGGSKEIPEGLESDCQKTHLASGVTVSGESNSISGKSLSITFVSSSLSRLSLCPVVASWDFWFREHDG